MIIVSSLPPPEWLRNISWAHESAAFDIAETAETLWLIEPTKFEYISISKRRDRLGLETFYSGKDKFFLDFIQVKPMPVSMDDLEKYESPSFLILEPDIDPLTDIILGSYSDKEKEALIDSYLEKYPESRDAAVVLCELDPERIKTMLQRFPDEPRLKEIAARSRGS